MTVATRISKILTHKRPHFDEILAIWLLRLFGRKKYPGIENATIIFGGRGGEKYEGKDANQWEAEGVLCIGVGGGKFDEHPGIFSSGFSGKCASDLVAEDLGVQADPALAQLLRFAHNSDLRAGGNPFDLASTIKAMHDACQNQDQEVINWAFAGIEAKYIQQMEFCEAQEVLANSSVIDLNVFGKNNLKLVYGKTNNSQFSKAAISAGAAVVVQMDLMGNVQIFTNHKKKVSLGLVAVEIRRAECEKRGLPVSNNLDAEGGADYWYYHLDGQMLLNGSHTCSEKPTALSLAEIVAIVQKNIL